MPRATPLQASFLGGELTPFFQGQVKADRYEIGMDVLENFIPVIQGGLTKRPGTYFGAETKTSTKESTLFRFIFSTVQAYMLEFGDQYIRFFRDRGQIVETAKNITAITAANPPVVTSVAHGFSSNQEVYIASVGGMTQLNSRNFKITVLSVDTFSLQDMAGTNIDASAYTAYTSGGTASRVYEIVSPYTESQVPTVASAQSADVMYLTHGSVIPKKLTRTGHTSWTISDITFLDGPYLPTDTSGITLTPSNSTSATPTLTASAALWAATDVGRSVRLKAAGVWCWMVITGYTSTTVVTVARKATDTVPINQAIGTAALTTWRLGIWSATTGYPSVVTFHEGRLVFAGAAANPQRFDASVSDDYENFAPSINVAGTDTVPDNCAISRSLNSDDVNNILWLKSTEKGLLAGTSAGEWAIFRSVQSEAMSPSNIDAKEVSNFGSCDVQPIKCGKSVLYAQSSGRAIREISYAYEVDGFRSPDRTVLADHIAGADGFRQMARQKEKPSINWAMREDGVLAGMTYEREEDALIVAWHRHIFGGQSDSAGSDPIGRSVQTIPAPDGKREDAWFIVKRQIGGRVVRTVEYLTKIFEHTDEQKDAYFVDCGLTYDAPITVSGLTRATTAVMTATSHGLANGDQVLVSDVKGFMESSDEDAESGVNGDTFTVRNKTTHTFELETVDGVPLDSSAFTAYVSGGEIRKYVTTITGLWHLEGEEVDILADGGVQPSKTVASGAITLQQKATTVHIGYSYRSRARMLPLEAGSADGTALGKNRRAHRCNFKFYRALGFEFGTNFDNLKPIIFRKTSDPFSRPPELFTGVKSEIVVGGTDTESQICWEQSQPLPGMMLAVSVHLETQDRG